MGSNVIFGSLYLDRWLRFGWYLDIVMLLLLGVASLMCRSDSVVFGLPGSWVWWWLIWCHLIFLPIIPLVPHWGIPHFIWRFMDPHRFARSLSLTGCSLRRGHDRYLMEPSRSIQLGPHFSTLGCHHASPSGRYILDICAWFSYGFGRPVLHVRWWMISCHLFFGPVVHLMPILGHIFRFRCPYISMPYRGIFPFG